jgi:hypothetical protein
MSYKETIDFWVQLLAPHEGQEYEFEVLASFECTVHGWIGDGRDEPREFSWDLDKVSLVKWDPPTVPFSHNEILALVEDADYEEELHERLLDSFGADDSEEDSRHED